LNSNGIPTFSLFRDILFFLERARGMRIISLRREGKRSKTDQYKETQKAPITATKNKETSMGEKPGITLIFDLGWGLLGDLGF
jgi:hypothetical protein